MKLTFDGWSKKREKPRRVVLPTGLPLVFDRMYLAKGAVKFHSVSFVIRKGSILKNPRQIRFWAKLDEVNQIDGLINPGGTLRYRVEVKHRSWQEGSKWKQARYGVATITTDEGDKVLKTEEFSEDGHWVDSKKAYAAARKLLKSYLKEAGL